jgi:hypothetical protein
MTTGGLRFPGWPDMVLYSIDCCGDLAGIWRWTSCTSRETVCLQLRPRQTNAFERHRGPTSAAGKTCVFALIELFNHRHPLQQALLGYLAAGILPCSITKVQPVSSHHHSAHVLDHSRRVVHPVHPSDRAYHVLVNIALQIRKRVFKHLLPDLAHCVRKVMLCHEVGRDVHEGLGGHSNFP